MKGSGLEQHTDATGCSLQQEPPLDAAEVASSRGRSSGFWVGVQQQADSPEVDLAETDFSGAEFSGAIFSVAPSGLGAAAAWPEKGATPCAAKGS
ncbi:MAG: pentapeptide repeat-containing protein [Halodesulfovibrio sp.]